MNKESLVRMVSEGHVIGDHSYDHMSHNTINDSPRHDLAYFNNNNNRIIFFRNAYVGLDEDITWFGQKSIDPATLALKEAGTETQGENESFCFEFLYKIYLLQN